jgi:hypothetical protein
MKPRIIFKFLYNFLMTVPILLQVLRQISTELTMLFLLTVDFGTPSYKFTLNICTYLIF